MDQTHRGYDPRVHRDHHVSPFSLHDYRDRGRHGHLFSYGRAPHGRPLYDHLMCMHHGRGHHDRLFSYGHDHRDLRDHQKYFSL